MCEGAASTSLCGDLFPHHSDQLVCLSSCEVIDDGSGHFEWQAHPWNGNVLRVDESLKAGGPYYGGFLHTV